MIRKITMAMCKAIAIASGFRYDFGISIALILPQFYELQQQAIHPAIKLIDWFEGFTKAYSCNHLLIPLYHTTKLSQLFAHANLIDTIS